MDIHVYEVDRTGMITGFFTLDPSAEDGAAFGSLQEAADYAAARKADNPNNFYLICLERLPDTIRESFSKATQG